MIEALKQLAAMGGIALSLNTGPVEVDSNLRYPRLMPVGVVRELPDILAPFGLGAALRDKRQIFGDLEPNGRRKDKTVDPPTPEHGPSGGAIEHTGVGFIRTFYP